MHLSPQHRLSSQSYPKLLTLQTGISGQFTHIPKPQGPQPRPTDTTNNKCQYWHSIRTSTDHEYDRKTKKGIHAPKNDTTSYTPDTTVSHPNTICNNCQRTVDSQEKRTWGTRTNRRTSPDQPPTPLQIARTRSVTFADEPLIIEQQAGVHAPTSDPPYKPPTHFPVVRKRTFKFVDVPSIIERKETEGDARRQSTPVDIPPKHVPISPKRPVTIELIDKAKGRTRAEKRTPAKPRHNLQLSISDQSDSRTSNDRRTDKGVASCSAARIRHLTRATDPPPTINVPPPTPERSHPPMSTSDITLHPGACAPGKSQPETVPVNPP